MIDQPNQQLGDTLRALYDEYNQRQKNANTLLKAIKGRTSPLIKIQQAFDGYAELDNSGELDVTRQGIEGVKEAAIPLGIKTTQDLKQYTTVVAALKTLSNQINTPPIDVITFSQALEQIHKLNSPDVRLIDRLPILDEVLNDAQQKLGVEFGMRLREAAEAQGLILAGSPPVFEIGLFAIAVDFKKRAVSIAYGKELFTGKIALSPDRILREYQKAVKLITERNESPDVWIEQFYRAWGITRKLQEASSPRVNVVDCYRNLVLFVRQNKNFTNAPSKNNLVDYSRAQFTYDFNQIALRAQTAYNRQMIVAHSASKAQTSAGAAQSLWIVEGRSPNDGRYIGDIEFSTRS